MAYFVKSLNNISSHFIQNNQVDSALYYLYQVEDIQKKYNTTHLKTTYALFGQCYEKSKQFEEANQYFKKQIGEIKRLKSEDSLKSVKAIKDQLHMFQLENEVTDKNILLEKQESELLLEKEIKENLRRRNTFLIISLVFVVLVMIYIYRTLVERKKMNKLLLVKNKEIEEKNNDILSSITYAKRIQEAILPQDKIVKEYLQESFIFYKPKDIVSGDFYWMEQVENKILFAAVDCTGHGVPGAFMSIVGNNGLNRAVREEKLTKPSEILESLNEYVIHSLSQKGQNINDGMDIALCCLDLKANKLQFSGANNPLYLIRNKEEKEVDVVKGDRSYIGGDHTLFTNHELLLSEGDIIYIFSDGFADQFGGENDKKFSYKRLKELFLEISSQNMREQKEKLAATFKHWKGVQEQLDDVCVIGVKI